MNIKVNGKPVEDLWREWEARSRECKELREDKKRLGEELRKQGEELRKQGEVIEGLKKRVKELEGKMYRFAVSDYLNMMERGKREMEKSREQGYVTF
jgi:predicted nuclease with TOPRIM domain